MSVSSPNCIISCAWEHAWGPCSVGNHRDMLEVWLWWLMFSQQCAMQCVLYFPFSTELFWSTVLRYFVLCFIFRKHWSWPKWETNQSVIPGWNIWRILITLTWKFWWLARSAIRNNRWSTLTHGRDITPSTLMVLSFHVPTAGSRSNSSPIWKDTRKTFILSHLLTIRVTELWKTKFSIRKHSIRS